MADQYTVQKILGKRFNKGRLEYKIKWEGYDLNQSTWEPIKNLNSCKGMLQDYENSLHKRSESTENKTKKTITGTNSIAFSAESDKQDDNQSNQQAGYKKKTTEILMKKANFTNKTRHDSMDQSLEDIEKNKNKRNHTKQISRTSEAEQLQAETQSQVPIIGQIESLYRDQYKNIFFKMSGDSKRLTISRKQLLKTNEGVLALIKFYEGNLIFLPSQHA